MGIVRRKYYAERMQLHKDFKKPIAKVAQTMPINFTDDDFVVQFRELEPCCWRILEEKYESYSLLDKARAKKHRHLRNFPSPRQFLLNEGRKSIQSQRNLHRIGVVDEEKRVALLTDLQRTASAKIKKMQEKELKDLYFIQEVCPSYLTKMIRWYYQLRKMNTLDVNQRLYMILECGKYRSVETITFLKKVQQGDKNEKLRMFAYEALLKMHAPDVKLHRKRKGREKLSQRLEPEGILNPAQLLVAIKTLKFENIKHFDIFMSHSSSNKEQIHALMKELNQKELICYIDWVEDRNELKRDLSCSETAEVIVRRILQSKVFVYVMTEEGLASTWCAWELGIAHAFKKPIAVVRLEDVDTYPEYIDIYPQFQATQISTDLPKWIKEQ